VCTQLRLGRPMFVNRLHAMCTQEGD
jgi:hypothetical protein